MSLRNQADRVEIAGSSNWSHAQDVVGEPNENVAVAAVSPVGRSRGPAAAWLASTGATPQPTFPTTSGISDAFYSEGPSSASFTSVSPRSAESVMPPVDRSMFSSILRSCNSLLAEQGNDIATLAAAEEFYATLTNVIETVGRLTAATGANLRDNPTDSGLYRKLVSHLVDLESVKIKVQVTMSRLKELSEEDPVAESST
ncbi:uncharacterized protein LOC108033523 [Drosophila biarmipes]|uniref:uncharacterized protein LOC108033523 n=1 Tax=Drosophila biarmipes TaxID=125945 RepID=UPI0007E64749|nr:uncharacterized protein LOC108033523 [Drosophila biarmipes]